MIANISVDRCPQKMSTYAMYSHRTFYAVMWLRRVDGNSQMMIRYLDTKINKFGCQIVTLFLSKVMILGLTHIGMESLRKRKSSVFCSWPSCFQAEAGLWLAR